MKLQHLSEVPLIFGTAPSYEVPDPRYGIDRFGPFDFTRERTFDSLTTLAIGPQSQKEKFMALWKNLSEGVKERLKFEPEYNKGLAAMYRLETVSLVTKDEGYVAIDKFPGTMIEKYQSALRYVKANFGFDILFIIEPETVIYYLHAVLKRDCINLGISSQYIEKETLDMLGQGSVLHNLAVATYAKAGGIPWMIRYPTLNNSCILGLSFHKVRAENSSQKDRTIVGVAELLDEFGRHLTMKVSQEDVSQDIIKEFQRKFKSLYVPKDLMENLIKDALQSTQWPGRTVPSRLVLHKTTPFHEQEISGLQAALEALEVKMDYALVHVKEETVQRVYREGDKNSVRGLVLTLRDDIPEAVLWTVGKVPSRYWDKDAHDYQYDEKSGTRIGTSDPIAIYLDPASHSSEFKAVDAAKQVFALTKMRWNTVDMSIRLPVSIYLARRVGTFVTAAERHKADMSFMNRVDAKHFW